MATLTEQQSLLSELHRLGLGDLQELLRRADEFPDFAAYVLEAYPELVAQYASAAAALSATWYEEAAPALSYIAEPAELPSLDRWAVSAQWALATPSTDSLLQNLSGSLQRGVFDLARETTLLNADAEPGAKWARHASANACEFCRMMATRGSVYTSAAAATQVAGRGKAVSTNYAASGRRKSGGQAKGVRVRGTQKSGSKYHDNCHCMAVAVRPGASYEPPAYVDQWEAEYIAATRATNGGTKAVLAEMRQLAKS